MKVIQIATCLFLGSILSSIGCKTDTKKQAVLAGRWEMQYAEINGQPAPSLERIYFQFAREEVLTNFNEAATDQTVPYNFDGLKIVTNSDHQIELVIENLTDSTLEMTTALRGYDFKLALRRAPPQ